MTKRRLRRQLRDLQAQYDYLIDYVRDLELERQPVVSITPRR